MRGGSRAESRFRCSRTTSRIRRKGEGASDRQKSNWSRFILAKSHGGRKVVPCIGEGNRRFRRRRRRGSSPIAGAPLGRHRGPLDGRHEDCRETVRRWKDVPASSRQKRPRDEKGRGLPGTLHGSGKRSLCQQQARHDGNRNRKGRRARHWKEHRRRGARLQQLGSRRLGSNGFVRGNTGSRPQEQRGRHRIKRSHYPIPRRNDAKCRRNETTRLRVASSHWWSHHEQSPYGHQNSPRIRSCSGSRDRCIARGQRLQRSYSSREERGLRGQDSKAARAEKKKIRGAEPT